MRSSLSLPMALTIAGSDSGGGAGIQADLLTFAAFGVHGCSAITAITAQNTMGVDGIWALSPTAVTAQIHSVLNDLPIQSIKTGMLYKVDIVEVIVEILANTNAMPLVVDPVLVASSGHALSANQSLAREKVYWQLLTRATLVTPNLHEAAQLLNTKTAENEEEMSHQARALLDAGLQAVLIKGGHLPGNYMTDILVWRENTTIKERTFRMSRVATNNLHGTGCTLSAAITAGLAKGNALVSAVEMAKHYLTQAIEHAKDLRYGRGHGPVQHLFNDKN